MGKHKLPRKAKKELQKINKELISLYPFLLPRTPSGEILKNFDYTWNDFEPEIPPGWWKRWGKFYCEDLKNVCVNGGVDINKVYTSQIKEKYGRLCNYLNNVPQEWEEHEYAWEYISEHTCCSCGTFPVPNLNDSLLPLLCKPCWTKNNYHYGKNYSDLIHNWNGKVDEFIYYKKFEKNSTKGTIVWIDMKPYYDMIGFDYTHGELIPKSEIEMQLQQQEKEESELQHNFSNIVSETDIALAAIRGEDISKK